MSQENVETVRSLFEAYERADHSTMAALAHPDLEIHPAMTGWRERTVYRGPDGQRQFIEDNDAAWAECHVEVQEYRDLGETVLVLGKTWAIGRDGIRIDDPGGWVCDMRQGKLHRVL